MTLHLPKWDRYQVSRLVLYVFTAAVAAFTDKALFGGAEWGSFVNFAVDSLVHYLIVITGAGFFAGGVAWAESALFPPSDQGKRIRFDGKRIGVHFCIAVLVICALGWFVVLYAGGYDSSHS